MLLGLGPHEPEELKSPTCIKLEVGPTAKPEFPGAHETGNFKGRVGEWRLLAKQRKKCKILL